MWTFWKRINAVVLAGLVTAMVTVAAPGHAAPLCELVSYASTDKASLNALLWVPPQPTRRIAILVPGFYGSMIGGHDYNPMAQQMADKGFAFMTINMRTASDFTDPRLQDAIPDVTAAVEFAKGRGYTSIVMMGTSLGGPRSMLYMAQNKDPAVKAYVLLAAIMSPYEEAQLRMDAQHKALNETVLADARALVASGRGADVVIYPDWFRGRTVRMTARGYLNTFGAPQDTDISTPLRGHLITVPTALFHGTKDEISLPPNAEAIYASLTAAPSRELIWVEGATHYLQPGWIAEEYARRISDWAAKIVPLEQ